MYENKSLFMPWLIFITLLFIIMGGFLTLTDYKGIQTSGKSLRILPIYSVETDKKQAAISFDAAWGDDHTDAIIRILGEREIKATFFLVGFWAEKHPIMIRRIAINGHEIGSHSMTHSNMSGMNALDIKDEILGVERIVNDVSPDAWKFIFRPPFGDYDDNLILACREIGYYPIQWDVDSLDWKLSDPDRISRRVLSRVEPGSIILFHNNADAVEQYLPKVLDGLIDMGYEIVPVSQLLIQDSYSIDHRGRQYSIQTENDEIEQ